jgi:SAM-dependent methyltransferase
MSESKRAPEWYREWFGEEYLALYPHRDEEEAMAAVELTLAACGRPGGRVLDLACGAGRHMLEFERRGIEVVGLDLSQPLLRQAQARRPHLALVRGDMRALPFRDGEFDAVVNFFTSFGYFAEPEDDAKVLDEVRRVLRRGGCFLLDFLNADRVRRNLVPRDERRLGDRRVVQERRLEEDGRVVVKEIRIFGPDGGAPTSSYCERVRLYTPAELAAMLEGAGLRPERSYGDYSGEPACADCPRHIVVGHAV